MSIEERLASAARSNDAALVATITYFRALRREWAAATGKPLEECPVPNWEDVRQLERTKFLKCMRAALAAAKPDQVVAFIDRAKAL